MTYCLRCMKPIENDRVSQWHPKCTASFFGTSDLPYIELNDEILEQLARKTVSTGKTIPGVQRKLSLHIVREGNRSHLTVIDHPSGFILKPQSPEYPHLPELEDTAMHLADSVGIKTVPHALIRMPDGSVAYISKRIDRIGKTTSMRKIAMEDFCQLSGRLTEDKYKASYEQCGTVLDRYSSRSLLDKTELWYLIVFCFIIGNSDMHLKNFSLYCPEANHPVLAPAYDLLPVKLVLLQDQEETALTLQGKKSHFKRFDFLNLADHFNIAPTAANKLIDRLIQNQQGFESIIERSILPSVLKANLSALIIQRINRLNK